MKHSSRKLGVYFGLAVSFIAIVWIVRSVNLREVAAAVQEAHLGYLLLAVLLTIASYALRAWRWPVFFSGNHPSFADSYRCLIVGFFANNVLPARMGEFVRAHLGGRTMDRSRTTVLATIAGERLADGVAISILFAFFFSFASSPVEREQGRVLFFAADLFAVAAAGTAAVIWARHWIYRLLGRLQQRLPGQAASYTLDRIRHFIDGLEPMLRLDKLLIISFWSFVVWFVELGVYASVAKAFSCPMTIGTTSLFLAVVNFSSLIPSAPAGVGTIEAATVGVLNHVGIVRETALAMVVVQHTIQFLVVGVPGALFFAQLGGKLPVEEAETDGDASETAQTK